MPEKRKKYDREFRDGAVRIVEETEKPTSVFSRSGDRLSRRRLRIAPMSTRHRIRTLGPTVTDRGFNNRCIAARTG